jgi:hypothetical protein
MAAVWMILPYDWLLLSAIGPLMACSMHMNPCYLTIFFFAVPYLARRHRHGGLRTRRTRRPSQESTKGTGTGNSSTLTSNPKPHRRPLAAGHVDLS